MSETVQKHQVPDTPFYRRMADGHRTRRGHAMTGYLTLKDGDDSIYVLVRTCCAGDTDD